MKIAIVTGTRAEFGLLSLLMHKIKLSKKIELQTLVTGAHLMSDFGSTLDSIIDEGFTIDKVIPEVSSAATGREVAQQVGAGTISFSEAFAELAPDAVVLLGDRYEILAAAIAAFFLGIPIVHLHGGEVTHGAFDDGIRHAVSKFAAIHAVAAPEYGERLARAGEPPDRIHVVGGFGVDAVCSLHLFGRTALERELGIELGECLLVVTYHPVTAIKHNSEQEIGSLLEALRSFPNATVVFTLPNADPESTVIADSIRRAIRGVERWHLFASLGSRIYLSLLSLASAVVGNSSSGVTEAPALGTPTVNIGPRQEGRLLAESVISCGVSTSEIEVAIRAAIAPEFLKLLGKFDNPYGSPGASERVLKILEGTRFGSLGPKNYYDPPREKQA